MSSSVVAITGASGYIGSQVLLTLLARYAEHVRCRAIVRSSSNAAWLKELPIEVVTADIHDALALEEAFQGVETVFHCAGLIAYTKQYRQALYETNVLGTRNVVNAALRCGVKRIVMTSSIAALGATEDDTASTETTSFKEWQRRNGYMEAKHLAELEGLRGVAEGLDVVFLNPGVVIGIDHSNPASQSSSNQVLQLFYDGKLSLCPAGGTGFVDVRDVAEAHIAAWQQGRSGERYIVVGQNLTFCELATCVGRHNSQHAGTVTTIPYPLGLLAALGGEAWSFLFNRPSFISLESIHLAKQTLRFNNTKSKEELHLHYRALSDTFDTIVKR